MQLEEFYDAAGDRVSFTREQGSRFAKGVAGDFNPMHDVDSRRFCIPGDLLFAVLLSRYGVSERMDLQFSDMVADGVELVLPAPAPSLGICDTEGREYLRLERGGAVTDEAALIAALTLNYVQFSGHTFPHLLQPLLAAQRVMINPQRPMVIYQSMSLQLDSLDIAAPTPESDHSELLLEGRRGAVTLAFQLVAQGAVVGRGCKRIALGGLRDYDAAAMSHAVADYAARKQAYAGS